MCLRIIYHGNFRMGTHGAQRIAALARLPGITILESSSTRLELPGRSRRIYERLRWRVRWPVDTNGENSALLELAVQTHPDVVFVDGSKMLRRATLRKIRRATGAVLVYFTPDDIIASHNLSWPLRLSFPEWDIFFTTKSFNVSELAAAGVRQPVLVGNIFDPEIHRPLPADDVGREYEHFDAVFIGTYETDRSRSINRLAEAGLKVLVHGNDPGMLHGSWRNGLHPGVTLRPAVVGLDYTRAMHHGKVALCFLRKMNRDQITQRSIEIPAAGRAMLAEKTPEHDSHFVDGLEYESFVSDDELVAKASALAMDEGRRRSLGEAGHARCMSSGYSVDDWALEVVTRFRQAS